MEVNSSLHQQMLKGLIADLGRRHGSITLIETHISSVLVGPELTYKIKKPLDLGFLDFSTLQKRKKCCEEEVRLNSRLAPDYYLRSIPITGSHQQPAFGGQGDIIEYAVEMKAFDPQRLLSNQTGLLTIELMDQLAGIMADFHARVSVSKQDEPFGSPPVVYHPMEENFDQIQHLIPGGGSEAAALTELRKWTAEQFERLQPLLAQRKQDGFIRECHGDLHLGNIALDDEGPIIFDGIEFNPSLRWIDTASELAFLLMDLDEHGRSDLGYRFLNRYLEISGDYGLLPLLRFYQVYRAMVRAKVTAIRLGQAGLSEKASEELKAGLKGYLQLARSYTRSGSTGLVITYGLSGSGKSWYCREQFSGSAVIMVRSDVERKRLAGLSAEQDSHSGLSVGIYSPEFTQRTYDHLLASVSSIVEAGFIAVVDATFLKQAQREPFVRYADQFSIPLMIVSFDVADTTLRQRITQRLEAGDDPSEANLEVLDKQIASREPLTEEELALAITVTEHNHPEIPAPFRI